MTLLELNSEALRQKIEAELASNPALEQVDEPHCATCGRPLSSPGICPLCSRPATLLTGQPIVFISPYTDFANPEKIDGGDDTPADDWNTAPDDLPTFILRQIALELSPEESTSNCPYVNQS